MASDRVLRRIERLLDQAEEAADQSNWERTRLIGGFGKDVSLPINDCNKRSLAGVHTGRKEQCP